LLATIRQQCDATTLAQLASEADQELAPFKERLSSAALAEAQHPVRMATAMRLAVEAGRAAFLAGRMPKREVAVPSSPETGKLGG